MSAPNQSLHFQHSFSTEENQEPRLLSEEHSEFKKKIHSFRTEIRNRKIRDFMTKKREEMLRVNLMQGMLEKMPINNDDSYNWASFMLKLYSEAIDFKLTGDQVVELFRLVQRFPNKTTFQLLELVILKADVRSINLIFQYDIMKLLHSSLTACQTNSNLSNQSRSNSNQISSEENQIIRQAVISYDSSKKIRELNSFSCFKHQIEFAKVILKIIGTLSQKEKHIRNFIVISHRSFTYCLKVYKYFGEAVRSQFYEVLAAFTYYPFQNNEEQFRRIQNLIFEQFFGQTWKMERNYDYDTQIRNMGLLHAAMACLLKQPSAWVLIGLQTYETKWKRSLGSIFLFILKNFNGLLSNSESKSIKQETIMIKHLVDCVMIYEELMSKENKQKGQIIAIIFSLSELLRLTLDLPEFEEARPGIYMLLGNFIIDNNYSGDLKLELLCPKNHLDLVSILSKLLTAQTRCHNLYEAAYCLVIIFQVMPVEVLQPLIFPSEILQTICNRILSIDQYNLNFQIINTLLADALSSLLIKLSQNSIGGNLPYRHFLRDQYGENLVQLMNCSRENKTLMKSLEKVVYLIQHEN